MGHSIHSLTDVQQPAVEYGGPHGCCEPLYDQLCLAHDQPSGEPLSDLYLGTLLVLLVVCVGMLDLVVECSHYVGMVGNVLALDGLELLEQLDDLALVGSHTWLALDTQLASYLDVVVIRKY